MRKVEEVIGKKFGRLTVTGYDYTKQLLKDNGTKNGKAYYVKCKCDCGNIISCQIRSLINGNTKSCGCLQKETAKYYNTTNGLSHHRLYGIWLNMIDRCYNINNRSYKNYGGRGINVCDEWLVKDTGINVFYSWAIDNGYKDNLTIDRIDNNGNYEPSNCRWVTMKEQANNRRSNINIEHNGEILTLAQWADRIGITPKGLVSRLYVYKWGVDKAINTPSQFNAGEGL